MVMMNHGDGSSGAWMWVFGGLIVVGVLVVIGLGVWAIIASTRRANSATAGISTGNPGGSTGARQVLDERFARGELSSEEYTERLHTLGLSGERR